MGEVALSKGKFGHGGAFKGTGEMPLKAFYFSAGRAGRRKGVREEEEEEWPYSPSW
jgi:hypothetical protein